MKLTLTEQYLEMQHRISNRLGELCGAGVPTPEQLAIAEREGNEWQRRYLEEASGDKQRNLL